MLDKLIQVNSAGTSEEGGSKLESHMGDGILHRAFSIILLDENGDVCVQRRSATKLLWPQHWSNACCSHPKWGESCVDAVRRRIREELGCEAHDLRELFTFRYFAKFRDVGVESEFCHVWLGRINSTEVRINSEEIGAVAYLAPELVSRSMAAAPEFYTPWFHLEWPVVLSYLQPRAAASAGLPDQVASSILQVQSHI